MKTGDFQDAEGPASSDRFRTAGEVAQVVLSRINPRGDGVIDSPPHHVGRSGRQFVDLIEIWIGCAGHYAQAAQYIQRSPHKGNEVEDLRKGLWYVQRLLAADDAMVVGKSSGNVTILHDGSAHLPAMSPGALADEFRLPSMTARALAHVMEAGLLDDREGVKRELQAAQRLIVDRLREIDALILAHEVA